MTRILLSTSQKAFYRDSFPLSPVILICAQILAQAISPCKGFSVIELYYLSSGWPLLFQSTGFKRLFPCAGKFSTPPRSPPLSARNTPTRYILQEATQLGPAWKWQALENFKSLFSSGWASWLLDSRQCQHNACLSIKSDLNRIKGNLESIRSLPSGRIIIDSVIRSKRIWKVFRAHSTVKMKHREEKKNLFSAKPFH